MLRRALLDLRSAAPPPHTATAHGPVCLTIRNRTRSCSSVSCWNPSAAPGPTTACLLLVASSSYASARPSPQRPQICCPLPPRPAPQCAMPFSCCPSSHAPTPNGHAQRALLWHNCTRSFSSVTAALRALPSAQFQRSSPATGWHGAGFRMISRHIVVAHRVNTRLTCLECVARSICWECTIQHFALGCAISYYS